MSLSGMGAATGDWDGRMRQVQRENRKPLYDEALECSHGINDECDLCTTAVQQNGSVLKFVTPTGDEIWQPFRGFEVTEVWEDEVEGSGEHECHKWIRATDGLVCSECSKPWTKEIIDIDPRTWAPWAAERAEHELEEASETELYEPKAATGQSSSYFKLWVARLEALESAYRHEAEEADNLSRMPEFTARASGEDVDPEECQHDWEFNTRRCIRCGISKDEGREGRPVFDPKDIDWRRAALALSRKYSPPRRPNHDR